MSHLLLVHMWMPISSFLEKGRLSCTSIIVLFNIQFTLNKESIGVLQVN